MNTVKIKAAGRGPKRDTYHHGDLRRELLAAAEQVLLARGVHGFTLREAARRAGVSPAAPAHHFGDVRGLLTEIARLGFAEFAAALLAADAAGGTDPARRLQEQAQAYVRFALDRPARFTLMFSNDVYDKGNPQLQEVAHRAYEVLEAAVRDARGRPLLQALDAESHGLLLGTWSIVHGFAHLALGGELRDPQGQPASRELILSTLLPSAIQLLLDSIRR